MRHWKSAAKLITGILILSCWLIWDLGQAGRNYQLYPSYKYLSEFPDVTNTPSTVSIIRSNDTTLTSPVPVYADTIDYSTIEEMVRKAVRLAGGFDGKISTGDMVLLKPNIVDPEPPGSGEVTDVRVIKALIKIIDEIDPGNIEIVVGEGAPRPMDYEMEYQSRFSRPQWEKLWDAAGYQDLLSDGDLSGVNLRFSNLNGSPPEDPWQDLVLVNVPGGGEAIPQEGRYFIHKDVVNTDFYITVPVMKIHTPGMTVALKNQIGLAPSTRYGFHKTLGVPQDHYSTHLVHEDPPHYWTDKEIVDLSSIAGIDFAVVDAIACLEREKSANYSGGKITNLVRLNTILASPDPVAADHVSARLMGLNPDDIEHITLAERQGLGTNDPDAITIAGASIEGTRRYFWKNSSATADFGQSNRVWLIKGPYDPTGITEPMDHPFISDESALAPKPDQLGWSEPVYFTEDRIDLESYFNHSGEKIGYAFTYFTAPRTQEAEIWTGSDEGMKIWVNGEVVYDYDGYRSFPGDRFVLEKFPVQIQQGLNRLLVKTYQDYGLYHFTFNICEPESHSSFDGNRVWGLEFITESPATAIAEEAPVSAPENFRLGHAYPNPFNSNVIIPYELHRPEDLSVRVYDIRGRIVRNLHDGTQHTIGKKQIRWDGTDFSGNQVSAGTYFIQFHSAANISRALKIVYLK